VQRTQRNSTAQNLYLFSLLLLATLCNIPGANTLRQYRPLPLVLTGWTGTIGMTGQCSGVS